MSKEQQTIYPFYRANTEIWGWAGPARNTKAEAEKDAQEYNDNANFPGIAEVEQAREYPEYPANYSGEEAYHASFGPREQVVEELEAIIAHCAEHIANAPEGWCAEDCERLAEEAQEFLDD